MKASSIGPYRPGRFRSVPSASASSGPSRRASPCFVNAARHRSSYVAGISSAVPSIRTATAWPASSRPRSSGKSRASAVTGVGEPGVRGITQRVGREVDLAGHRRISMLRSPREKRLDLGLRVKMDLVGRLRPDQVRNLKTPRPAGRHHHVGQLLLPVEFTAGGDRGQMPEVIRPVGTVVPVEQPGLGRAGLELLLLETPEKLASLGEPCARRRRQLHAGIMHGELPAARAPHRQPTDHDALLVDRKQRLDVGDRFENVYLAGKLERVGIAAIRDGAQSSRGVRSRRSSQAAARETRPRSSSRRGREARHRGAAAAHRPA